MPAYYSSPSSQHNLQAHKKNFFFVLLCLLVCLLGVYFRTSGLFRGLVEGGFIYHPDEPKQILALFNFLNGDYIRYYGSLFYDGYPYGLNHLDEYLLRPFLFFFQPETPEHLSLYYYARLLRLIYSLFVMFLTYKLVFKFTGKRAHSLLALFFIAIAPLPITVSHFATGDIGIDLFGALCILFLLFYIEKSKSIFWTFCCGITIGAAFSAKYNGLLLAAVPGIFFLLEYSRNKQYKLLLLSCLTLAFGFLVGLLIFTPNLVLDFKTTLSNIFANFKFIKNYNVPNEVLNLPFIERAFQGLEKNTFYIISSLGYIAFLTCIAGIFQSIKKYFSLKYSLEITESSVNNLLLSIALFPIITLVISLSGKYVVQPFHFSYLQLPIILVACSVISHLLASNKIIVKGLGGLLIIIVTMEYFPVSWNENFFWRHEDNGTHAEKLPPTLYDSEAFYTHRSDSIRSLYLEEPGPAVFRNLRHYAKGPDAFYWRSLEVAPLPQVANQIGNNYIFINGPTFPRNERMIKIHGEKIQRFLVLPAEKSIVGFGIQSGSKPTEIVINFGNETIRKTLAANEQKIVSATPKSWRQSGKGEKAVHIIPLTVTVPYNTAWLTILVNEKEQQIYNLFGGGQYEKASPPEGIADNKKTEYFDVLSRIKFLEHRLSWRVAAEKRISMWEVEIPAGRYILTAEIDGLADSSEIAIDIERENGNKSEDHKQSFKIIKGIQRIEYSFTKPFAPYQTKFIVYGVKGKCQVLFFKLTPDYQKLDRDFDIWRQTGVKPGWVSRFSK